MNTFSVRNFDKFQHYKDRSPPWIKLYNELLDDYEFGLLPDASKMHLIAIWLLASRSDNKIPYDSAWISRRINATEKVNLQVLVDRGFILLDQELHNVEQVASMPLAKCLSREREEGEERREENCTVAKATRTKREYSEEFEQKFWNPYPRSPTMAKTVAWKSWLKLSPDDRFKACQAIEPYRRYLKTKPDLETVHACRFLSQRRFEGFSDVPPPTQIFDIRSHLA
jgi:hypothetical protein